MGSARAAAALGLATAFLVFTTYQFTWRGGGPAMLHRLSGAG